MENFFLTNKNFHYKIHMSKEITYKLFWATNRLKKNTFFKSVFLFFIEATFFHLMLVFLKQENRCVLFLERNPL